MTTANTGTTSPASIPTKPLDCLVALTRSQRTLVSAMAKNGDSPLDAKGLVAIGAISCSANVSSYIGSASKVGPSKAAKMEGCTYVHEYWDQRKLKGYSDSKHYSLLGLGLVAHGKTMLPGGKQRTLTFTITSRGKAVAKLIAKQEC